MLKILCNAICVTYYVILLTHSAERIKLSQRQNRCCSDCEAVGGYARVFLVPGIDTAVESRCSGERGTVVGGCLGAVADIAAAVSGDVGPDNGVRYVGDGVGKLNAQ